MRCVGKALRVWLAPLLAMLFMLATQSPSIAQPVRVFAAASLKTALDQIIDDYGGIAEVSAIYASSSVLARQISQGAPADVYISANESWMDYLETEGHIARHTRSDILSNRLVLVSARHAGMIPNLTDLPARLGNGRLAVAQYNAVPAGLYAREAFETLGIWAEVQPNIVQTDNVRAALAFAATGAVDFAVVYASDAFADGRVQVVASFPTHTHSEIRYPAAIVTGAENHAALEFLEFLSTSRSGAIFQENGFNILQAPQ